jgi:hypothetical protein
MMNGNESHASVYGVGMVDLMLTLEKRFDVTLISAYFSVNKDDRCV